MSYVPAFERRYKSIGKAISTLTDHASRDTVIGEGKSRLSKFGNATTADAAAIAKEVAILNTALAHAAEEGRVEDVSHLTEELNGWLEYQVDVGERTTLATLRQENAAQGEVAEQLRDKEREKDTRIRELEAATTSHQDVAQQLRDKTQTQGMTLQEKEKTIQSLQAQLEQQKQASVTEVTQLKSQSEQSCNDLLAQLEASENQATDLRRKWDAERRRANDLQPKAAALAEKKEALQSLKAQSAEQTEAGVTSVTHWKTQLERTCSKLEASKGSAAALEESLDAERRRAEDFESKAVALEKTQKDLQEELERQRDASVTEVTDWKNELEQTRLELQTQLDAKEAQAAELEGSRNAERARAHDLEGQNETNSNQALGLYNLLNEERNRVRHLENQLGTKRNFMEELQSQLESSITEQERLRAGVLADDEAVTAKISALEQNLSDERAHNDELQGRIQSRVGEAKDMKAALEREKALSVDLRGQLETITAERDTAKSQMHTGAKAWGDRVTELKKALEKERGEVKKISAEKDDLDRGHSRKHDQLQQRLEDHIFSLQETLGIRDATVAGLEAILEEKERETEWFRASTDKAWDEAEKTVDIANEAMKARAAVHLSHNQRKQSKERNVMAESAIQRMSKICTPAHKATVGRPTDEDIESVLQRMKSVLDSEDTTVEEMD
ncbi:hypothetical protein KC345_g7718 [Hortaea werneckii]|nr:hypothetical protein KC345_g7718 [Hortaea werneckii]